MTGYAFKALTGSFVHPLGGSYILGGGNVGFGQLTIAMALEKTEMDVASDGTVMVSYISGDNGTISVEVQQTSSFHLFLLNCYNLSKTAADLGDPSMWAAGVFSFRNGLDATAHFATGVAFSKIPDMVFQKSGQKRTWAMPCASIVNE